MAFRPRYPLHFSCERVPPGNWPRMPRTLFRGSPVGGYDQQKPPRVRCSDERLRDAVTKVRGERFAESCVSRCLGRNTWNARVQRALEMRLYVSCLQPALAQPEAPCRRFGSRLAGKGGHAAGKGGHAAGKGGHAAGKGGHAAGGASGLFVRKVEYGPFCCTVRSPSGQITGARHPAKVSSRHFGIGSSWSCCNRSQGN
jgi:hypothetical protein